MTERTTDTLTDEQLENYIEGLIRLARFNEMLMDKGPCEEREAAFRLRRKARRFKKALEKRKKYGRV